MALPALEERRRASKFSEEKKEKVDSSQPYRILVVEENEAWLRKKNAILQSVRESDLDFEQVPTLVVGLQKLAKEEFTALLVGRNSLSQDAVSDVAKLRAQFASLPIVVAISRDETGLGERLLQAGASDYLVKETTEWDALKKSLRFAVEREARKQDLQRSEQRAEELFESANDIIFTLDLDGNFTSINNSAVEVMGWSKAEALGVNLKTLVAPEHLSLCRQMMQRILNDEPLQQFEINLIRKDGQKVLLEVSARLIQCEGKNKGVQGIARDVTERRRLESVVRQSQKLEAIGRLSGGLAHDFNNLLCVISGHTELLAERLMSDHPSGKNVAQIKKAVDSASTLVRQLLAFSRKQVFYPQTLDLNKVVIETEKLLSRLIGEHIQFSYKLHREPWQVRVDPVQIEQTIVNLALNARDAMPHGGNLNIQTENVELGDQSRSDRPNLPAGQYVLLVISDDGHGMDEYAQNRIFEPFYSTKELGKGAGLGLATVYGIVKQSGGAITVDSQPHRGTTFKIYFPRVEQESTVAPRDAHAGKSSSGTETILLVENEESLRALAKEFLKGGGYAVLEAENGKEAIRIANAFGGPIDLLLTDVIMPEMGGKQLADQLKTLRPTTRILYMSGYSDEAIAQSGVRAMEMLFLEKPFTRDILLRKVRRILDEAPQQA